MAGAAADSRYQSLVASAPHRADWLLDSLGRETPTPGRDLCFPGRGRACRELNYHTGVFSDLHWV